MLKLNYRPEVDGLRALAIIAVIFYHFQIFYFNNKIFQGGYLGVDIFFIISGYLITLLILKEQKETKKFSIINFYKRRVRRIIPALLVMILFTCIIGWLFLLPYQLIDFLNSIISSIGFSSNFYFHYTGERYFNENGLYKLLLHTWSLSVEEQFYFIFPFTLVLVFRYFNSKLLNCLCFSFFVSLLYAQFASKYHPSFNFYMLPSRSFEFLAGSILAYYNTYPNKTYKNLLNYKYKNIYPCLGFLTILCSIFLFSKNTHHPSFYTLIPVMGTCLIILFSNRDEIIFKILSSKLLVNIGLISYSLYLWHYPILVLDKLTQFSNDSIIKKILLIIIIFFISYISYNFVEKKFRDYDFKFNNLIKISIIIIICLVSFSLYSRSNFIINYKFEEKIKNYNEIFNTQNKWEKCKLSNINNEKFCKIGKSKSNIYLIGDSHVIPLARDLGEKLKKNNFSLQLMYEPGFFYKRNFIKNLKNDNKINKSYNHLKKVKNSIFIFGGYYQRESSENLKLLLSVYQQDFKIFKKNNNKIIFIYPVPIIKNEKLSYYNYKYKKNYRIFENIEEIRLVNKYAIEFINSLEGISRVFPEEILCDNKKCYLLDEKMNIFMSDDNHLAYFGAKKVNELIIKEIHKIIR